MHAGEIVSIIGPNGAGKTTFMRTLSGVRPATAGTIQFKGQPVQGLKPYQIARLGISHCPEGRAIFQHLSIEENLMAGFLDKRGKTQAELFDKVYALFPILAERRKQGASRLSGGQQQMLAIGRALMGTPELLLLDEPSLGLAPLIIHQIFEIIIKLAQEGVSILLVEQNVDLSLEIADYVYAFEHGTLHCAGPAEKLSGDARVREIYLPA
jgi:branched-chain amino acid transport system ATP-binding protein